MGELLNSSPMSAPVKPLAGLFLKGLLFSFIIYIADTKSFSLVGLISFLTFFGDGDLACRGGTNSLGTSIAYMTGTSSPIGSSSILRSLSKGMHGKRLSIFAISFSFLSFLVVVI